MRLAEPPECPTVSKSNLLKIIMGKAAKTKTFSPRIQEIIEYIETCDVRLFEGVGVSLSVDYPQLPWDDD